MYIYCHIYAYDQVSIVDFRTKGVVASTGDLGRNLRVVWCRDDAISTILTVSTVAGVRTLNTWDPRNMSKSSCSQAIDNGSGQLFPFYEEASGLCGLVGKGDTIVRFYESKTLQKSSVHQNKTEIVNNKSNKIPKSINDNDENNAPFTPTPNPSTNTPLTHTPYENNDINHNMFTKCNEYISEGEAFAGFCTLPCNTLNVRKTEICRLLKLTVDSVVPISFSVPRYAYVYVYMCMSVYIKYVYT
jgi:hypothetical protein